MTALPGWIKNHYTYDGKDKQIIEALAIAWEALEEVGKFHVDHLNEPERTLFWKVYEAKRRIEELGKE